MNPDRLADAFCLGMLAFAACSVPPVEPDDINPRMVVSVGARPGWAARNKLPYYSPDRRKLYAVGWGKSALPDQSPGIALGDAQRRAGRVLGSPAGCRIKSYWEDQSDRTYYALAECPAK
jgi:hypothetical protein